MMSESQAMPHQLVINDRHQLSVSGVSDVDSFDDTTVIAHTPLGELSVHGHDLQICRFSIESGDLSVEGQIDAVEYTAAQKTKRGMFGKLFK